MVFQAIVFQQVHNEIQKVKVKEVYLGGRKNAFMSEEGDLYQWGMFMGEIEESYKSKQQTHT